MLHIGLAFLSLQEVQHGVMIAFTSTLQKLILVTILTWLKWTLKLLYIYNKHLNIYNYIQSEL